MTFNTFSVTSLWTESEDCLHYAEFSLLNLDKLLLLLNDIVQK